MTFISVTHWYIPIKAVYLMWGLTNITTVWKIPLASLSFSVMTSQEKMLEYYSTPTQSDNQPPPFTPASWVLWAPTLQKCYFAPGTSLEENHLTPFKTEIKWTLGAGSLWGPLLKDSTEQTDPLLTPSTLSCYTEKYEQVSAHHFSHGLWIIP